MYHETNVLIFFTLLFLFSNSASLSIISPAQTIKDGDLLVSEGEAFALGFFSPGRSSKRYVGIWYKKVPEQTIVWVANRESGINGSYGVLSIDKKGDLVIHGHNPKTSIWSTNTSIAKSQYSTYSARLMETGNLVLFHGDENNKVVVWQSFDYPTHTLLPYMKLGVDLRTGLNRFLTSWKSPDDPGTGSYSFKMDLEGSPAQAFLFKGPVRVWRTGPWINNKFSGIPQMTQTYIFNISYIENSSDVYVMTIILDPSVFSTLTLNESGDVQRQTWHSDRNQWVKFWSAPKDQCDYYNHCGPYGNCNDSNPVEFECRCLPGYEPKSGKDWYLRDGFGGCVPKNGANETCWIGDGFVKITGSKLPDTNIGSVNRNMGLKECALECLKNCSCKGYASADFSQGRSGCITWHGELVDIREFPSGGQDLYLRVDANELESGINGSYGVLSIDKKGDLVIHGHNPKTSIWSTNTSIAKSQYSTYFARLMETGNLVLFHGDENNKVVVWQSFDYPTHTLLPYMKLGVDLRTGLNRFLTSWKSPDDPGTGSYSFKMDLEGSPAQAFLFKGPVRVWRTGPWINNKFSGIPQMTQTYIFNISYIENSSDVYVMTIILDPSVFSTLTLNESGDVQRQTWHSDRNQWVKFWSAPKDQCDYYNHCGPYGNCNDSNPVEFECRCLPGYEPKSGKDWYLRDGFGGCVPKNGANETCWIGDGFVKITGSKLPDSNIGSVNRNMGLKECALECLKNCSCKGYASADFSQGRSGCITWHGELVDIREFPSGGQDLYLRVDANELESGINGSYGVLSIDKKGDLVIHGHNPKTSIWSTNTSIAKSQYSTYSARLMETGNLVLFHGDENNKVVVWQSFDYPTHTLLPYMKLGVDLRTGLNRFLTSWKSPDDPGTGSYSFKMDLEGSPAQAFLFKGPVRVWRTGPWINNKFSGIPQMTQTYIFNISYIENSSDVYVMTIILDPSVFSTLTLNESGDVQRQTWHSDRNQWVKFWSAPKDQCDYYNHCGPYGNCNDSNPVEFECRCLPGYEPKSGKDWYLRDGFGGCVPKNGANETCWIGDGFVKITGSKLPDTNIGSVNRNMGLKECALECLKNCSCKGYASADFSQGRSGCITWHGELVDIREFPSGGQDLYLRVDANELAEYMKSRHFKGKKSILGYFLGPVAAVFIVLIFLILCLVKKRKAIQKRVSFFRSTFSMRKSHLISSCEQLLDDSEPTGDLPHVDLSTVVTATDNFSVVNKLGQGGFGTVYKGVLVNGQVIAVKRLSKSSGQGAEEFKNEVTLIAKLQHRNLVRLLGFCVQQEEKMLIYEYLPNKGLDDFIFDKNKGSLIDWRKRHDIILGIARGLLYLHQDSRLRIIHRDLKASNVLLDSSMNPKISDFGMARIFGGDQIEANTNRVVGTYGYMSPEYAMEGLFSVKSDVFSFGVLLLEIISGTKNSSHHQDMSLNLIGHVWSLWKEDKSLEAVDPLLDHSSYESREVLRCIHIGLLCVQEQAMDRPTMSEIAFMLSHETILPSPKQPAFILKENFCQGYSSSSSVNGVTLTVIDAR